jgi:hypothetical protein
MVGNIHGIEASSGEGQGVEDEAVGARGRKQATQTKPAQDKTHGRGQRSMARRYGIRQGNGQSRSANLSAVRSRGACRSISLKKATRYTRTAMCAGGRPDDPSTAPYTHTHAHTRARAHTHTQTHTHTYTQTQTHTHKYTHTHTHTVPTKCGCVRKRPGCHTGAVAPSWRTQGGRVAGQKNTFEGLPDGLGRVILVDAGGVDARRDHSNLPATATATSRESTHAALKPLQPPPAAP